MVCGDHIVYCFLCFCGSCHQQNQRTLVSDISYRDCQKGTKFGSIIEGALLYITTETGEFWPNGSPGAPKVKGVKICNSFLVHRLAERDEI